MPPLAASPGFSREKEAVPPLDLALLHDLPSLELKARYIMEGFLTGMHRSPRKGFSVEFAEYRAYQLGDDLRRIDWRLYGRTDRLHLKQYEQETQLRVFLVLDTSGSMAYSSKPGTLPRKIDFARALLAALGLLALRQGDAFGFAAIGGDLDDFLRARAAPSHWRSTLGRLDGLKAGGATNLARGLTTLAELLPRRSMVVIASDFYEQEEPLRVALRRLHFDRHEVMALQILDPVEIDFAEKWDGTFVDAETGDKMIVDAESVRLGYLVRFRDFLGRTETTFLDQLMDYTLVRTDANPTRLLGSYLAERQRFC